MVNQLAVLIPVFNEQDAISKVIDEVKQYTYSDNTNIVVVNNNSMNGTREEAMDKGAIMLDVLAQGKGYAVRTALRQIEAQYYIILDGDYTYNAKYIPAVLFELMDRADVVIGCRKYKQTGSMTPLHRFGNFGLSLFASFLYNYWLYDICSGMWGFRKEVIEKFKLTSSGFTLEADFLTNTMKGKYNLVQIPIEYRARLNGSQAKLQTSDGLKIGWFLMRGRFKK